MQLSPLQFVVDFNKPLLTKQRPGALDEQVQAAMGRAHPQLPLVQTKQVAFVSGLRGHCLNKFV